MTHGRAMRSTPPKPISTPSNRVGVTRSLRRKSAAATKENSGMAPLSAPAMPEGSRAVPAAYAK